MKMDDIVSIYDDPFTETKEEGKARLVQRERVEGVHEGRLLERWTVEFTDHDYTDGYFERSILEPRLVNQSAFDIATTSLLRQGKVCEVDGRFMYRCGSLRSALGWLIPDEIYETAMDLMDQSDDVEGISIPTLLEEFPALKERFRDVNIHLLDTLESIHDVSKGTEMYWKSRFVALARQFDLSPLALTL